MAKLGALIHAANPDLARQLNDFSRGERRGNERHGVRRDWRERHAGQARDFTPAPDAAPQPLAADPGDARAVELSARGYVERKRTLEIRRRVSFVENQKRALDAQAKREARSYEGVRALPQHQLACLGRLVIVSATDLPCGVTIAAAWPGDHDGLICAYLDSQLYEATREKSGGKSGWWYEPVREEGTPGGAVDLAEYGVELDVFPRAGAWQFRAYQVNKQAPRAAAWSRLNVGTTVLHIRFKGDLEAALKGETVKAPAMTDVAPGGETAKPEGAL